MSFILGLILIEISGTGIMSFCAGSFVLYLEDALHFKRSAFFLINSVTILVSSLSLPLFKKVLYKIHPSKTVILSSLLLSLNYLGFSVFKNYRAFLALGFLNGLFINGISSPLIIAVLREKYKKEESRILGLILCCSTLFSSLFINILRFINENYSYVWGYRLISVLGITFALSGAFLIRGTSLNKTANKKLSFKIKEKSLLLISLILFFGNFSNLALFNNLIPFCSDLSFSSKDAHFLSSIAVFLLAASRILWGCLFSKREPLKVLFCLSLSPFLSSLLYFLSDKNRSFFYLSLIFIAFNGCFNSLPAQPLSKLYKNKESDALTFLIFSSVSGSSLGSCCAALFYDTGAGYIPFWKLLSFLSFLFCLLSFYVLRHYSHDGPVISG